VQAQNVALLLFRYPMCKQITDRRFFNRPHASLPQKGHSITPTGYLAFDRLAEHA
jgi:hypothetical protein